MNVVALAGGVGGAKLAVGLAYNLPDAALTVVVNTGDDFEHLGLKICPDLDTVCYTLAGLSNPETGWGMVGETWNALQAVEKLSGPAWFHLGDRDLGTHLERTRRLREGEPLSQITRSFCKSWGIGATVLPMTDDAVATHVIAHGEGRLPFQEYFVKLQCQPQVTGFRFEGIEKARPAPGVLEAIQAADCVVICPSNPWVSIGPILDVPGVRPAIQAKTVVAVSPIIGGKAVKGPAAKMYAELGIQPSALAVARHYGSILSGFVLDDADAGQAEEISHWGIINYVTNTLMLTPEDRYRFGKEVLVFCEQVTRKVARP